MYDYYKHNIYDVRNSHQVLVAGALRGPPFFYRKKRDRNLSLSLLCSKYIFYIGVYRQYFYRPSF